MNNNCIYKEFTLAKNGTSIPVLISGRTIESRYNPDREAENQIQSFEKKYSAFLILGIGSGILIKKIKETFPDSIIIAIEKNKADIDFLFKNEEISRIQKLENVYTSTVDSLEKILCEKYLPAKYGDLKIIEQRNWIFENQNLYEVIKNKISFALKQISADFSVQSHFGKLWCNNIIHNLQLLNNTNNYPVNNIDTTKNAYIIGAGPSIDKSIETVLDDSNRFIISTDTGFQILQKYKIKPDIVISLDGQNISYNHFMNYKSYDTTMFLFDLTGDFSACKNIPAENRYFFISGHPFSVFVNTFLKNTLPVLFSGAGTVTISALDLAIQLGFSKIKVLGADFSYINGKSYAKGTYLDLLYNYRTTKINSNENLYDKLLFRTPLTKIDEIKATTPVLESYKESFLKYMALKDLEYSYKDFIYEIKNTNEKKELFNKVDFNFSKFLDYLETKSPQDLEIPLLPLIAYFRKVNNYDENLNYLDFLKLAHSFIVSYN